MIDTSIAATGYYKVGESVYTSKLHALMDGSTRNIHPEWIFHQAVFNSADWHIAPAQSITDLYQQRARAIRERYDHVCLLYSGGIDSQNILESFLGQGLRVDELVTTWSVQAAEEYSASDQDRSPSNYIAEWLYCIQPQLDHVRTHHPDIKITVDDSTQHIANNIYVESDFFLFDHYHNLPGLNRWPSVVRILERMQEQNRNSVVLVGVDKPQLVYDGSDLYVWFVDVTTHIKSSDRLNVEYFYWSPQSVDIMRKQCHLVFDFFDARPEMRSMLYTRDDALLRIINQCIYPTYTPRIFQANKNFFNIFNEQQRWAWRMTQYQNGSYVDRWISDWRNFLLVIDDRYKRYVDHVFDGFVGFVTPKYHIGRFSNHRG